MADRLYSVKVIAKLFNNVSERWVQQLAKDGIIPKADRGKYDLVGCVQGYIKHLQELALGKDIAPADIHAARNRLLTAQAEVAEMDAAQRSGRTLDADAVGRKWENIARNTTQRLLGIPSKAAPQIVALKTTAEIKDALEVLIHECLHDLSTDAQIDADRKIPVRAKAPAKAKRKPVGRRKPKAKPGGKRRAG